MIAVLYVPVSGIVEAKNIVKQLIISKLIACGNIISTGCSIYVWEGEIIEDTEVYLLLKTRESLVVEVTEAINLIHSYSIPCIIRLSVESVNNEYEDWIIQQTKDPSI